LGDLLSENNARTVSEPSMKSPGIEVRRMVRARSGAEGTFEIQTTEGVLNGRESEAIRQLE
jgi:hypothetical protein